MLHFNISNVYLVKGVRRIDSDAIEKLYNAYFRKAYLYTFSLCGSSQLAEDIVQEAFVKAMLALECTHGNVQAWLFSVCKNLWIDHMRKVRYMSDVELESINLPDSSSDFISNIIKTEESARIYKLILAMPHSFREVLILFYYSDLPQNKIAELMNISEGAVRTLLYRARKKLKNVLEEDV